MTFTFYCAVCSKLLIKTKSEINKGGIYYCSEHSPAKKKPKIKLICSNCNKSFEKNISPSQEKQKDFFCKKSCSQEFIAKTRAKKLDCKICNKPLKIGEGYPTDATKGKKKDYICDKCRSAKEKLVEIEKIKIKRIAIENLDRRMKAAIQYIKEPSKCAYCGKTIQLEAAAKKHCAECKLKHRYRKSSADHKYVINSRMRNLMNKSLRGGKGGISWKEIAGYSVDQLVRHLEKQFVAGMTWGNMNHWHIDHIIPVSKFNYNSHQDPDFKKCWALSNLRPMWASENISKSNKLYAPMQPSLSFFDSADAKPKIGRPKKGEAIRW